MGEHAIVALQEFAQFLSEYPSSRHSLEVARMPLPLPEGGPGCPKHALTFGGRALRWPPRLRLLRAAVALKSFAHLIGECTSQQIEIHLGFFWRRAMFHVQHPSSKLTCVVLPYAK